MRSLSFRRQYVPAILDGRKTATVRAGRVSVQPGEEVEFRNHWSRPAFARARILGVRSVTLAELTVDDAARLGHASRPAMVAAVEDQYPGVLVVHVIDFRVTARL